ncbi:MAG: long-chain acyl-CoA synthetase [Micromonosporaceae bacterium]
MSRTVADLPFDGARRYGALPALRYKRGDSWQDQSFADLAGTVRAIAGGLVETGVSPGDRVCVLGETSPEWTQIGLGVIAAGAVVVPVYPTSSVLEREWIVSNSGAKAVLEPSPSTVERLATGGWTGELERRRAAIDPDDPCVIIYTSGTTGPPKGCVLTHRNWLALCHITEELSYVTADDVVYLFLPLAHVFAQLVQFGALYSGATLAYFGGDLRRVVAELAEVRPTFLPSVPRIFEKLHTALAGRVDAATVRGAFGGRLRLALSGAAPISLAVLEYFHAVGVPVVEGYGMTETTGCGTVSTLDRHRLGTVGVAAPGVSIRLAEDGEILMAGPNVFAGYWQDPEATRESLVDGWLHTGDLGTIDEDGFITITGRKKDIIITAGGKNVAPAELENQLRQSRWISQALVYGDRRPYPVVLLTLDADEIVPWARDHGLPTDLAALAAHPQVRDRLQALVDAANERVSRPARIKRFAILERDFTLEAGELTPTLKLKRAVVHANHATVIEELYGSA